MDRPLLDDAVSNKADADDAGSNDGVANDDVTNQVVADDTAINDAVPPPDAPLAAPVPAAPGPKRTVGVAVLVAVAVLSGATAAFVTNALDGPDTVTTISAAPGAARARVLSGKTLDVAQAVAAVSPSVVSIRAQGGSGGLRGAAAGTGIVVSADGDVITNAHVVEGASTVKVTLGGESQSRDATVVGADDAADLALLKITGATGLPAATLGKSSDVRVGDDVVAIGNALALKGGPSVTRGIISALDRTLNTAEAAMTGLIQTDASISSGNSGGPLVDAAGRVIGINTAVAASGQGTAAENIGFAIAIDNALPVVDRLRTGTAEAAAGYLGVRSQDPTDGSRGAVIDSVESGSAAQKAGLRAGDLITAIDGRTVDGAAALGAAIRALTPGSPVRITFIRSGSERTVTANLNPRPTT